LAGSAPDESRRSARARHGQALAKPDLSKAPTSLAFSLFSLSFHPCGPDFHQRDATATRPQPRRRGQTAIAPTDDTCRGTLKLTIVLVVAAPDRFYLLLSPPFPTIFRSHRRPPTSGAATVLGPSAFRLTHPTRSTVFSPCLSLCFPLSLATSLPVYKLTFDTWLRIHPWVIESSVSSSPNRALSYLASRRVLFLPSPPSLRRPLGTTLYTCIHLSTPIHNMRSGPESTLRCLAS
jgi:hypothetical protein